MPDCIFCKIIEKKIPSKIVYEDAEVLAFEDINPQAPVHVLIIPKTHIPTVNEVKPENYQIVGKLFGVAAKVAKDKGIDQSGYRSVFNCNRNAGMEVYHLHLHVLGGRKMTWPPG